VTPSLPSNFQRIVQLSHISAPIIIGMASQNIMNLIDTAMVGRLGTAELGAVGISGMAIWVFAALLSGLSPAIQTMTSRRLGSNEIGKLHEPMVNAMAIMLILGIPYSIVLADFSGWMFDYLADDADVKTAGATYLGIRLFTLWSVGLNFAFRGYFNGLHKPMVYMGVLLFVHPLNVLLNYMLIFGKLGAPEMGIEGAALGTAIATVVGTFMYIVLMIWHRQPGFSLAPSQISLERIKRLMDLGIPSAIQSLMMALGFLAFFRIASLVGKDALAATHVIVSIIMICILASIGFGMGALTLISKSLGANLRDHAHAWIGSSLILGSGVVGGAGLIMALFPDWVLSGFILDEALRQKSLWPMRIVGLSQFYDAAAIVLMHVHYAGQTNRLAMIFSVLTQWVFFIPVCLIWVLFFDGGLTSLMITLAAYRFLLFLCFWISYRKGTWITQAELA
jgi:putative MATE family efflux protein